MGRHSVQSRVRLSESGSGKPVTGGLESLGERAAVEAGSPFPADGCACGGLAGSPPQPIAAHVRTQNEMRVIVNLLRFRTADLPLAYRFLAQLWKLREFHTKDRSEMDGYGLVSG